MGNENDKLYRINHSDDLQDLATTSTSKNPTTSDLDQHKPNRPRSCASCRARKVKCDKKQPCHNCIKSNSECIFLQGKQRVYRKRQELKVVERLSRLEGIVNTLGVGGLDFGLSAVQRHKPKEVSEEELINLESRVGRLVVREGTSRYITPSFWASLSNEVEDIRGILEESDSDNVEQNYSPAISALPANGPGYIFGPMAVTAFISNLHPPPEFVQTYWNIYKEKFDPLIKVIYIPSTEAAILERAQLRLQNRPNQINRYQEALLFAIYYAVATCSTPHECRAKFGEEKADLIARYRFGVEQTLARADFLQSGKTIILQAFIIFLTCLRKNNDNCASWIYTGIAVRIAQRSGLHRDGDHYGNLTPFQIELRRRIWWQTVVLDALASEDHGCDPILIESLTDTRFPRNINDCDFRPDSQEIPDSKTGCTEMTYGLIRFEISSTLRKIQYVPPGIKGSTDRVILHGHHGLEHKKEMIRNLQQRIDMLYLKDYDISIPLYWVIATASRLILSSALLMLHHPFQRKDCGASLPQDVKDGLFETALQNIECALLLEGDERGSKFRWFFRMHTQWHAIAFLLNELCSRSAGPDVERAWRAIETIMSRRQEDVVNDSVRKVLWDPLGRLLAKAKAKRKKIREPTETTAWAAEGDKLPQSSMLSLGNEALIGQNGPIALRDPSSTQPLLSGGALEICDLFPSSSNPLMHPVLPDSNVESLSTRTVVDDGSLNNAICADFIPNDESTNNTNVNYNEQPILDDEYQLDWANWDDLVQEFGMQYEGLNSQPAPSGYGSGSNWF